jgi:hypothetical protein
MTLKTFFQKFDQFADAPDAVAKMLAPLPGCDFVSLSNPVVSLRSTTGYRLESLRDKFGRPAFIRSSDAGGNPSWSISQIDAGGIPACSRWSSPRPRAIPPEPRFPFFRTPEGVPARPAHP